MAEDKKLADKKEAEAPGKAAGGSRFPEHWGEPPRAQTRDLVKLPGNYGMGSGTLARWIREKMAEDEKLAKEAEAKGKAAGSSRFPEHWGEPPRAQTKDLVKLPGNYGMGSGTLARWIREKMAEDNSRSRRPRRR